MKKRLFGLALAGLGVAGTLASCGQSGAAPWGKVNNADSKNFVFTVWNDEFKGFFQKYASDEGYAYNIEKKADAKAAYDAAVSSGSFHIDGLSCVWLSAPSDNGQYQDLVDFNVQNQKNNIAKQNYSKVADIIVAEADYITKYANSDFTQDIEALGVTNFDNIYGYTKQAASDAKGTVKGVSFQCCPSGMIYKRSIAKAVLGTDKPEEVQAKVDTWEKFDAVAKDMKEKGYYMTACDADTYRVFSNNASSPWVVNNKLTIPAEIQSWMDQAEKYAGKDGKGYTVTGDVWSGAKTALIKNKYEEGYKDEGQAFCTFGPAWYYNFCMGAKDFAEGVEGTCKQDGGWAVCKGPQGHFWGGTWLLAASGSQHTDSVAKIMNRFINDEKVCEALIKYEGQFTNNKKVNKSMADSWEDGSSILAGYSSSTTDFSAWNTGFHGNAFLGGQNDTKMFNEMADSIKFENATIYDQLCNEGIQQYFREYLEGTVTKEKALENFYDSLKVKYPNLKKGF